MKILRLYFLRVSHEDSKPSHYILVVAVTVTSNRLGEIDLSI